MVIKSKSIIIRHSPDCVPTVELKPYLFASRSPNRLYITIPEEEFEMDKTNGQKDELIKNLKQQITDLNEQISGILEILHHGDCCE